MDKDSNIKSWTLQVTYSTPCLSRIDLHVHQCFFPKSRVCWPHIYRFIWSTYKVTERKTLLSFKRSKLPKLKQTFSAWGIYFDWQQMYLCIDCIDIWVFPEMVVPPKHPKMIIFSRKPMVVGETLHFRKPPCCDWYKFHDFYSCFGPRVCCRFSRILAWTLWLCSIAGWRGCWLKSNATPLKK